MRWALKFWNSGKRLILGNLSILLFFAVWQLFTGLGWVDRALIPLLTDVISKVIQLIVSGELTGHVLISLKRTGSGFLMAAAVMVPLGFLLGGYLRIFNRLITPLLRLLEKINPFALFPVFILAFGIGETSKIIMIYWVCQWPVLFYTILGVQEADPLLLRSARSMGANRWEIFRKVIFPFALPSIFTGLRIGAQTSFFIVISAEMLGSSRGLGWLTGQAQISYRLDVLFGATLVIAVLGVLINTAFRRVEGRFLVWQQPALEE